MNKVIVDLEFCKVGREAKEARKISSQETIQVGAVKLDKDNRIIGTFSMFVRPEYGTLTRTLTDLTGITEGMLAGAAGYARVMDDFLQWIGPEETTVYSWSREDEYQIRRENALKHYENDRLEELLCSWQDLQKMFMDKLGLCRRISLESAVDMGCIGFSGPAHMADSDAYNTAVLYQIMADEELFLETYDVAQDYLRPKESLTFSFAGLFTEELLKQCASDRKCSLPLRSF